MNSIEKSKFCLTKSYTYSLNPLKFNRNKCATGIYSETQIQSAYSTPSKQSLNYQQRHGNVTDRSYRLDDWLMESAREYLRPPIKSLPSRVSSTVVPQISRSHCYIKNRALLGCLLLDRVYEQNSTNASGVTFTIDQIFENRKLRGSRYVKKKSRDKNFDKELTKMLYTQKHNHEQAEIKSLHTFKDETHIGHATKADVQIVTKIDKMCEQNDTLPLASYVECPSEILQKMTNLEIPGYDTLSSITGTDVEVREDFSSNYIMEQDDSSLIEGQSEEWIRFDNTNRNNVTDVRNARIDKNPMQLYASQDKHAKDLCYSHDYRHHYCWRREVTKCDRGKIHRDCRGRCINCQKYRIRQIQVPRLLVPFSKRVSVGRICRRRRNVTWRPGNTNSQSKMKKQTSDLQRSIFWDNADAQTAVLLYHGAGTDDVMKELKSADIAAAPQLFSENWSQIESNLIALALADKEVAGEKCHSKPVTISIGPDQKDEQNNDTSTRELTEMKKESATSIKKGNDKISEQGTSLSIYKLQMIDRVIKNVDSLVLISKNETSSASTTLVGASDTLLKIQDEDIQTDVVNYAETETYVNYNQSMDTPFCDSSFSESESFCKACGTNTDYESKSYSTKGITTSDIPRRSVNFAGTQISPDTSMNEALDGIIAAEIAEDSSAGTADEWSVEKANSSTADSEDSAIAPQDSVIMSAQSTNSGADYLVAKDVSTEITSKEINLEMETSRYLCCKQYETHTHGTCTGSSLHTNVNEKNTSITGIALHSDVGITAYKYILTNSFGGGPTSQIPYTTGASTGGLVALKSFNGGSHHSLRSFVADVHPERTAVSTSTKLPTRNKSTGINSITNDRLRRPITIIQNDSETDLLWNLDGSLFDMLLRSCSSDVATQVLQIFANSRDKKKNAKNSLVGRLVNEVGATVPNIDGNSFESEIIMVDQSADAKPLPGPSTSKGVCTSDYLSEVAAQTSGPLHSSQIRHQSHIIVNKLFKSKSSPLDTCNVLKGKECSCVTQEKKPQQCKVPDPPPEISKCASKTSPIPDCGNCRTVIVNRKSATADNKSHNVTIDNKSKTASTGKEAMKREKKQNSHDIATSVRSVAKRRKASPLISPNESLRVNASGKCTAKAECSFVYNSPHCFANATQKDTSLDVLPQGLSGERNPEDKKFRTLGLLAANHMPIPFDRWLHSDMMPEFLMPKGRLRENIYGHTAKVATQTSNKDWRNNYEKKICTGPLYDRLYQNISSHQNSPTRIYKRYKVKINPPSSDDHRNCSLYISNIFKIEACTMKPSNYSNAASQTYNLISMPVRATYSSTCVLSPALSLTEICGGRDKNDLRTVYFMLSAIEGRIRRLKRNVRLR